jgi:hypothetical protein
MTESMSPSTPEEPERGDELQLVSDSDGLAVIGHAAAVERFLHSEGLVSKDLDPPRLRKVLSGGAAVGQTAAVLASASGRWVKLTDESAKAIQKWGLMRSNQTGLSMGVVYAKGDPQGIKKIVQFASDPGTLTSRVLNPLVLANVASLMQQIAMQQSMDEIADYLATIDEKVDDVLRAQKDAVIADMIGVDLVIEEAMAIRQQVGLVGEVTWSKVQATSATVAATQAYALRQLDALASKLENKADMDDLVKAARDAGRKVQEWVAILARCFQLQDALAVLELDRVMTTSPHELKQHQLGLKVARQNRLELISRSTVELVERMNAAAAKANAKVLFNPFDSPAVVRSSNRVVDVVVEFHAALGIGQDREGLAAKRWRDAVAETRDRALEAGSRGVDAVAHFGSETLDRATEPFRSVDIDGDGVPDRPRAVTVAEGAGAAIKNAASRAVGTLAARVPRDRKTVTPAVEADSLVKPPDDLE